MTRESPLGGHLGAAFSSFPVPRVLTIIYSLQIIDALGRAQIGCPIQCIADSKGRWAFLSAEYYSGKKETHTNLKRKRGMASRALRVSAELLVRWSGEGV